MNNDAIQVTQRWWQAMFLTAEQLRSKGIMPASTAQRAQLRRCNNLDATMLSEGFRNLWLSLPESITAKPKAEIIECWAAIAAALVFVTTDSEISLACAAGKKGDGDKSIVSELRFTQLQNAKTADEFLRRLRRILLQIGGVTSVKQLTKDIYQWFSEHNNFRPLTPANRIAVCWAMDYYQAAK